MPLKISRSDRKLLIGAGVFFVVVCLGVVIFQPQDDSEEAFPSTYSVRSGGAKATFLFIERMGFHPERWEKPPSDLPTDGSGNVLILTSPVHWPNTAENADVQKFLRSGGTVVAAGRRASGFLPHAFQGWASEKAWTTFNPLGPSDITNNAPHITMRRQGGWLGEEPGTPLYGSGSETVAVSLSVGKGRVIWLASDGPLTNSGLKASGNAVFLASTLSAVGAHRVLWDLYFTEAKREESGTFNSPPLYFGAAQLLLVFLLAVWTFSRRFGPVRPLPTISRLSPLEFVDVLGSLYMQRRATHVAVDVAYRRFRSLAARRLALPTKATTEQVARAAYARVGSTEDEVSAVLNACESARYGPEMKLQQALHLCVELNRYLRKLQLITEKTS